MKSLKRIRNLAIVLFLLCLVGLFPEWYTGKDKDMFGFMWLILTPTAGMLVYGICHEIKQWRKRNLHLDVEPYITVDSTDKVFCATYYDFHGYQDDECVQPVFIPVLCCPTRKYQIIAWFDAWCMAFSHNTELIWRR